MMRRDGAIGGNAGLRRAHDTLRNGTAFLGLGTRNGPRGSSPAANLLGNIVDVRLLGNGLRELDRFLGVLIEEVARRIGTSAHDPQAFARLRNTANKLRSARAMMDLRCSDHPWLCAVGRLRVCLHHCGGEMRHPGHARDLSLAGCKIVGASAGRAPRGTLVLTAAALDDIASVYRRVGDDLVTELDTWLLRAA